MIKSLQVSEYLLTSRARKRPGHFIKKRFQRLVALLVTLGLFSVATMANAQNCHAPVINSFSPNTGYIGSTVSISGSYFDPIAGNNQVFFGATQAQVVTATFGTLTVKVPVGATYAPITVKNGCGLIGASSLSFNGIFCPTTITNSTYNTVSYSQPVSGGYQMVSQDMDQNGKPDLLVTGFTQNSISIVRNLSAPGSFNFAPEFRITLPGPSRCQVPADFDGDGKIDIAVTVTGYGTFVYRNTSTPGSLAFTQAGYYPGSAGYQIAAGDLNKDGKIDLVNTQGAVLFTYRNTSVPGSISFVQNANINNVHHATGLAIADVDGDGIADVGTSSGPSNVVTAIRNTTTPGALNFTFAASQAFATGSSYPYRLFLGDFDKDGKIDFTANNYNGATTSIFRNTSSIGTIGFAPAVNLASPGANYRIGVGDADGDGDADIVTKSSGVNVFSIYINTSSGPGNIAFSNRIDYPGQAEVSGVLIADLDGDNVPDVSTSGISYNTLRVHRNNSTVTDATPPTALTKNIIVPLNPAGQAVITPEMVDNGSSDACGIGSLSLDKTSFSCLDLGENEVVLTVTDRAGNTATKTAQVKIVSAAIIVAGQTTVCQGQTVEMTANVGDSYQWFKDGLAIAGASSQNYTATESGNYAVAVTNAGGCSGTSVPTPVTVNNNPTATTFPTGNASICAGGNLVITASESSIYQWYLNGNKITGATQQTYNATAAGSYTVSVVDLFGCSASSAPILVNATDNIAPIAKVKNVTVALDANESASISVADINDGSSDNCSGVSLSLSGKTVFSCAEVGQVIAVTLSVTDASGNVSTAIAQVSVTDPNAYCNAAPVAKAKALTLPAGENCQANAAAAVFNDGSTDADGDALSFSVAPAGPYALGTTAVVFTVTDSKGTSSTYATTVTVQDQDAPVPVLAALPTVSGACFVRVTAPTATDNCKGSIVGTTSDPTTYTQQGTFTITWTYQDGNGNTALQQQTVKVEDVTPPTIAAPMAIAVSNEAGKCGAAVSLTAPATSDNCGVVSVTNNAPAFFPVGTTAVTWTVTDVGGNVATTTQMVTVSDQEAPVASALSHFTVTLADGVASVTAQALNNGSTDACGIASMQVSPASFSCANIGANTVTLTVTDGAGNVATTTASVIVMGAVPVSSIQVVKSAGTDSNLDKNTIYLGYDDQSVILDATGGESGAAYAWSGNGVLSSTTSGQPEFAPTAPGVYTFTVVETNSYGCMASSSITITVVDVRAGNKNDKIAICHNNQRTAVAPSAVKSHLAHGDQLGFCGSAAPANARMATKVDYALELGLTAYPNPALGKTNIEFTMVEAGSYALALYDLKGSLVKHIGAGAADSNGFLSFGLDARAYPAGVYLIRLATGREVITKRLIIEK